MSGTRTNWSETRLAGRSNSPISSHCPTQISWPSLGSGLSGKAKTHLFLDASSLKNPYLISSLRDYEAMSNSRKGQIYHRFALLLSDIIIFKSFIKAYIISIIKINVIMLNSLYIVPNNKAKIIT
jgi:hypothetical protein